MTIATWIDKMRRFTRDFSVLTRETWDGDGATLAFRTNNKPILESSYTIKSDSVIRTETTNYTLDKDTGLLQFLLASVPAIGSDNVSIDYKYANLRDEDWMEIYNNVVRDLRGKLYLEGIDTTHVTTVANQYEYALTGISTNIVDVLEVFYRTSSSKPWTEIGQTGMNWHYLPESNQLQLRPYFDTSGYAMKIHYLYGFTEATTTSSTVTVPDKWLNVVKFYAAAEYYERIVPEKLTETAIVTKERTYHPADTVIRVADYYRKQGDKALAHVRPPKRGKALQNIAQE